MDNNYESIKQKLEEKTGDSTFYSAILGMEKIPVESLAAMGSNVSLEEFLSEMKQHGLEVMIAPRRQPQDNPAPTEVDLDSVHLSSAVKDTPESRKRYLELREKAQQKLGETGYIQSFLETDTGDSQALIDETALKELNSASYQGDFGELRDLSKHLKKEEEHHED